ncbi:D-alanyl-D-alanine carboxypeptidase family protein [Sphingosinicella sp. LY1275]|uniref:D-alanyl-D-alanine carboxypeptidase family protein n=1 Tax=Sphingosinicella sp. LY1275 TaxID=3095379 RepID=UPI002ADEB007|nr:D-alanyl-D-alanine carboxypeptidase family protein [Sphingosinicella sp. LY1275]MEA1013428.1 D-alanyl-D-alanine carboxypeptidase family protein [Sphingosinicella sp. LY1275]
MKRNALVIGLFTTALTLPASAAAPPFDTVAPVAFMKDLSSGAILYAKDADRRMPPASMAKMMTTHVAFTLVRKGEKKLDEMCTVRPETWQQWHGPQAGSTMFLSPGEQVSIRNLLHGIVTLSGNDASVVLAECIAGTEPAFAALMNQEAKRLGMTNSNFGNSNGWPDEGVTYTSARDLAALAQATLEETPDLYKEFYQQESFTWGKTMGGGQPITQGNRNPLLGRVKGADGLKTGHTQEAGFGFTGSAEQNGRRLVMVVAGLTGYNQRADESVKFMNWGFGAWKAQPLYAKGKKVTDVQVQLGSDDTVGAVAPRNLAVTLPAGVSKDNVKVKVVYNGPVKAPIKAGQHIADLVVQTGDTPPQTMPLIAEKDVGEAGFFGRLWASLMSLFG